MVLIRPISIGRNRDVDLQYQLSAHTRHPGGNDARSAAAFTARKRVVECACLHRCRANGREPRSIRQASAFKRDKQ
jgi:hypothetical protein